MLDGMQIQVVFYDTRILYTEEFMSKREEQRGEAISNEQESEISQIEDDETDEQIEEKPDDVQIKIIELEEENSELKNQYLRKQADFENFRKRMFREKEDAIKYANSSLLGDVITIIDDFERAIAAGATAQDVESFRTGIEMIEKQLVGMLERKYGLMRFDSAGAEFDPEKHEAIGTEESAEYDSPVVLEDYQKGYMLHDRVLRHAKVKVSVPITNSEDTGETGRTGQTGHTDQIEDSINNENEQKEGENNG